MPKPARTRAVPPATSLIEHAPFGMFRFAADGTILEANPAVARMLGHDGAAGLVGLALSRDVLADPADLPRMCAAFDRAAPEPVQCTWRRRDRTVMLVRTTGRRVPGTRGAVPRPRRAHLRPDHPLRARRPRALEQPRRRARARPRSRRDRRREPGAVPPPRPPGERPAALRRHRGAARPLRARGVP